MYVNKIDKLINSVIDDFYSFIEKNKSIIKKIHDEVNFVKYQKEINELLINYFIQYDKNSISKIISNEEGIYKINNVLRRYISMYVFIFIGIFYNNKRETFINNLIEFTRNQPIHKFKVKDFFNGENNSHIIKFTALISNIIHLLSLEPIKFKREREKEEYKNANDYINNIGEEITTKSFKLESLKGNKLLQAHNLIKTIILNEIYFKNEKKEIYDTIEASEEGNAIYTFIEIIIPKSNFLDFNAIESLLSEEDIRNDLSYEIYDMLTTKKQTNIISDDDKINRLINAGVIIPITEDFLRYHKDTEKYEKPGANFDPNNRKKKEDTKIRYIVSKIDSASEYYSSTAKLNKDSHKDSHKNIEKNFNVALYDRRAVLINVYEEAKIINKMENQINKTAENSEYYNDLISIKTYPYLNFKEFQKYGFKQKLNAKTEILRSVSLESKGIFRQNPNNTVQVRIGFNNMTVNIVGFMYPSKVKPLPCLKINQITNIRNLVESDKAKNGFNLMLQYLSKTKLINKKNKSAIYWLFDLNKDVIRKELYNNISGANADQETIRMMMGSFYDNYVEMIITYIVQKIKELKLNYADSLKYANNYLKLSIKLNDYDYLRLKQELLKNTPIVKIEEDVNEDIMTGLFGNIVKLLNNKKAKKINPYNLMIKQDMIEYGNKKEEISEAELVGAICQHFVDWDTLHDTKKLDPGKFGEEMFNFISKYVFETHTSDFICKSCGTQIDIKKYVQDGVFDSETNKFVTFSTPMEMNLEEMKEYQKYKVVIRSTEKLIERIASIANIQSLMGNLVNTRIRRKKIVKSAIDLLLLHNHRIKESYQNRKKDLTSKYGVSLEYSRLFRFELENNIFIYSSRDTDKYKQIKYNNVIAYIIILVFLELNESQIVYLATDKICNYINFEKAGHILLDGLNIVRNKKQDTISVRSLRVLSYLIYYFACISVKFKIWNYDIPEDKQERKKIIVQTQKAIAHTVVDVLNSILEFSNESEQNYIYEMITTKFFISVEKIFKNKELAKKLHYENNKKSNTMNTSKQYVVAKIKPLLLLGEYKQFVHKTLNPIREYNNPIYYPKHIIKSNLNFSHINNITNSIDGKFRNWKYSKGKLIDNDTGKNILDIILNKNDTETVITNHRKVVLLKLAERMYQLGDLNKIMNNNSKYSEPSNFDDKAFIIFEENLRKSRIREDKYYLIEKEHAKKVSEEYETNKVIINKLRSEYSLTKNYNQDYFNYINEFIDKLYSLIGSDKSLLNKGINIKDNIYIIDHNHEGHTIRENIHITDSDNKIKYKNNHPFFKKNVIYYTNESVGKIDIYYDASTHVLVGFKESHRDYVIITENKAKLKIMFSIKNKIKQLGYTGNQITIYKLVNEMRQIYPKGNDDYIIKKIFSRLNRDRLSHLKLIIRDIVQIINQLRYNYKRLINIDMQLFENDNEEDVRNITINTFRKKLTKFDIRNKNGKNKIFNKWNTITNSLQYKLKNDDINFDIKDNIVTNKQLADYDYNGNILLFYLISELNKLLDYNDNKFIKNSLALLIVKILSDSYDKFDTEEKLQNKDIKRFEYIINSKTYVDDIQDQGVNHETEKNAMSIVEDIDDDELKQNMLIDAEEERDALDLDIDSETDMSDMYQVDYTLSSEDS